MPVRKTPFIKHPTKSCLTPYIKKIVKKHIIWFFFPFLKAQKALLEAEAEKVPNSAESTEIDEPAVQTVFIDAPPPKVNVWLKKSDNPTSSQQQSSAQENSSQDENMEKEPTPEAPEVKTGIKTSADTNSNAPTSGTKTTATKVDSKYLLFRLKFIYSEKATKFCEISTLLLTVCTVVNSKVEISQNFVAFSEYMNFNKLSGSYKAKSLAKNQLKGNHCTLWICWQFVK